MKILALLTIALIYLGFLQVGMADEIKREIEMLRVEEHYIEIKNGMVMENISFKNIGRKDFSGNIVLWICCEEARVKLDGVDEYFPVINENVTINLSHYHIKIAPQNNISLRVYYSIHNIFEKKIIYDTEKLTLKIWSNKFLRGNVPLSYNKGKYTSSIVPKRGDFIFIEFESHEKKSSLLPMIFGVMAIFLGIFIILLSIRMKRKA